MSGLTTYAQQKILDHIGGGSSFTQPSAYLALLTAMPTSDDGDDGTEVTGGSYARQQLTDASNMGAASGTQKANDAVISFTNMPSCTVVGAVIVTHVSNAFSSTNVLFVGELVVSKVVGSGTDVDLQVGDLILQLT